LVLRYLLQIIRLLGLLRLHLLRELLHLLDLQLLIVLIH